MLSLAADISFFSAASSVNLAWESEKRWACIQPVLNFVGPVQRLQCFSEVIFTDLIK